MHHNVQLSSDVTFQNSNSYFYIDFIYYKSEWADFLKKKPSWILFSSNVRQPWEEKKLWEFFKKSKFLPEKCTYLPQICFIKIWTAYLSNWDTVKHWLSFFLWTRWQNKRQISECMVIFMSQAVRNVSFTINYFSHQFNHQNVSREKQLALFSGFCFYNNNNNKNRKKY